MEPVALEDRLRIAREQRAEALARRQASVRTSPAAPARRQALREPTPDPIELAPSLSVRRPQVARPVRRTQAPARVTHTLGALFALVLTVAFVMSHGTSVVPPEDRAVSFVAPMAEPTRTVAVGTLPTLDPTPAHADDDPVPASVPVPASAPDVRQVRSEAADPAKLVPLPAAVLVDTLPPVAAADPALAAVDPPAIVAPRTQRVLVNAPSGVSTDATLATLRTSGFDEVALQPTRLTIRSSSVRYYHSADAAAAAEVAALIRPGLPGGLAEARDFSNASSRGAPGHLEVWIASAPRPAAAPEPQPAFAAQPGPASGAPDAVRPETSRPETPGGPAGQVDGVDPDQIRRLVESVFSPRTLNDLGGGASDLARDMEDGANSVVRGINAAVASTVRRLEGRP